MTEQHRAYVFDTHSAGADVLMCAEILRHAAIKVGGWRKWHEHEMREYENESD